MKTDVDEITDCGRQPLMFREPARHLALRQKVIPFLRTYPFIQVWHPGCGTGAEVYATAILLREEGLHDRTRVYATEDNETVLTRARQATYPLASLGETALHYQQSGGTSTLSEYYSVSGDQIVLRPLLAQHVAFFLHDPATDASFNQFQLILCRGAMTRLAPRVFDLLHGSLCRFGILGLGPGESLRRHRYKTCYEEIDGKARLYRRVC